MVATFTLYLQMQNAKRLDLEVAFSVNLQPFFLSQCNLKEYPLLLV